MPPLLYTLLCAIDDLMRRTTFLASFHRINLTNCASMLNKAMICSVGSRRQPCECKRQPLLEITSPMEGLLSIFLPFDNIFRNVVIVTNIGWISENFLRDALGEKWCESEVKWTEVGRNECSAENYFIKFSTAVWYRQLILVVVRKCKSRRL